MVPNRRPAELHRHQRARGAGSRPQPLSRARAPKQKAPAPGAWSEGRLAFVTQGLPQTRVTGGNPGIDAGADQIYAHQPDAAMNGRNLKPFLTAFFLRFVEVEGAFGDRDIVTHVR